MLGLAANRPKHQTHQGAQAELQQACTSRVALGSEPGGASAGTPVLLRTSEADMAWCNIATAT